MKLAQKLINLPIITIDEGQEIGNVKDIFLDNELTQVTGISLGSEGLLTRSESFIRFNDVITVGQDAIVVQDADCILDEGETPELSEWLKNWTRRDELKGREMKTAGGTRIGRVDDVILGDEATIVGFSLSQAFVKGPVAENKVVNRAAIVETRTDGNNESITIDLSEAERADLQIVFESLFSKPTVAMAG